MLIDTRRLLIYNALADKTPIYNNILWIFETQTSII